MKSYANYEQYVVCLRMELEKAEKQRDEARAIARKLYAENEVLKVKPAETTTVTDISHGWICSTCGSLILMVDWKFCPGCGRRIEKCESYE